MVTTVELYVRLVCNYCGAKQKKTTGDQILPCPCEGKEEGWRVEQIESIHITSPGLKELLGDEEKDHE